MTARMTLHVLYGIACAGKSTTALQYARDNDIRTVVHTDYLREVQRLYVPAGQSPALAKVSHSAWELFGSPSPENIVAGFLSHAESVFPAVEAVAGKLARDGLDAVIEGTHFHGSLIARLRQYAGSAAIRPALVTVATLPQLLEHISPARHPPHPGPAPQP